MYKWVVSSELKFEPYTGAVIFQYGLCVETGDGARWRRGIGNLTKLFKNSETPDFV